MTTLPWHHPQPYATPQPAMLAQAAQPPWPAQPGPGFQGAVTATAPAYMATAASPTMVVQPALTAVPTTTSIPARSPASFVGNIPTVTAIGHSPNRYPTAAVGQSPNYPPPSTTMMGQSPNYIAPASTALALVGSGPASGSGGYPGGPTLLQKRPPHRLPGAPPPRPPESLTEGFPAPDSIALQKADHERALDEQLERQLALLAQRHRATLDFLRRKTEQQKRHTFAAIDQALMQSEVDIDAKVAQQHMALSQAANQRKLELDSQARLLAMEYNMRQVQEQLFAEDFEVHRNYYESCIDDLAPPHSSLHNHASHLASRSRPGPDDGENDDDDNIDEERNYKGNNDNDLEGEADMVGLSGSRAGRGAPSRPSSKFLDFGGRSGDGDRDGDRGRVGSRGRYGASKGTPTFQDEEEGELDMTAAPPRRSEAALTLPDVHLFEDMPNKRKSAIGEGSKLIVRVLSARKLGKKDTGWLASSPNPFVLLTLGKQEKKTPVVYGSVEPVWETDNSFTLKVPSTGKSILNIEVFSANRLFANDSLGRASVEISTLTPNQTLPRKLKLKKEGGGGGEVELELQLKGSANRAFSPPGSPASLASAKSSPAFRPSPQHRW